MPITPEELTALQAAAAGETIDHEVVTTLTGLGLVVRTPKAEAAFKQNYLDAEFGKRDATAYTNIEAAVKEATGIDKLPNEKASDYFTRAFKADSEARATLTAELAQLKQDKADGTGSKDDTARIAQLEKMLQTQKEQHTQELTKKEQEKLEIRSEAQIETALGKVRAGIKKSIDPAVIDDVIESRLNKFNKAYKPKLTDKGVLVYVDAEGEIASDPDTFKPYTGAQLVETFFKDLKEDKKEQPGGGSGKDRQPAGGQRKPGEAVPAPGAEVRTQMQLTTYLKEQGLATGTKEFDDAFDKYKGDKPLR